MSFKNVSLLKLVGHALVTGIFNYNGTGSKKLANGKTVNNYRYAKQDKKGHDFTSQRCIKQLAFKDILSRQPSKKEALEWHVRLAGSEIGLLRGIMHATDGLSRQSPLSLLDAWTDLEEGQFKLSEFGEGDNSFSRYDILFAEVGVSSKPKENNLVDKNGEEASDTSLFNFDNAPRRKQIIDCTTAIDSLAFINLDPQGTPLVNTEDRNDFLIHLKATLRRLGAEDTVTIANYGYGAGMPVPTEGILLNDNQLRALVKDGMKRITTVEGHKNGSEFKALPDSFKVTVRAEDGDHEISIKEFNKALNEMTFKTNWKKV